MKLTKTATKLKPGMTLIEITVVILVLLTLISVLFIGANIYKKGADRAACILNIRNIQQAVRADQNLKGQNTGDDLPASAADPLVTATFTEVLIGAGKYFEVAPECPSDGDTYVFAATVYPAIGTLAGTCANIGTLTDHVPSDIAGW